MVNKRIERWDEIIENVTNYQLIKESNGKNKVAINNFSKNANWYYLPEKEFFAPGVFIAYKNTTIKAYHSGRNTSEARRILNDFSNKHDNSTSEFKKLYQKLLGFAESLGKKVNSQTERTGIFVLQKREDKHNLIYNTCQNDIISFQFEEEKEWVEGEKKERLINYFERKPQLRAEAIKIHGTTCMVCRFNFKEAYGDHGENFIEVHHLKPLYTFSEATSVNPEDEMIVLCSNCHRMIHRNRNTPLTLQELKAIWQQNKTERNT